VPDLSIRAETPSDRDAIRDLTAAAFGREHEARLVDAVRESENFVPELSLVAEHEGRVVGHVLLSYVGLDSRRVLELGPLSVAPDQQRKGIGGALAREALRLAADERGEPLVLLLGHPGYYPRFGFRPAHELGITPPDDDIPTDAFMAIPLRAYDATLRGRVVFPPPFVVG
jgi:putative acetyltransferase